MLFTALLCFTLTCVFGLLFWTARPAPHRGATFKRHAFAASVHLDVTQLYGQSRELVGPISVQLGPTDEAGEQEAVRFAGLKNLWFRIEKIENSANGKKITIVGETEKPIPVSALRLGGIGTFRWTIPSITSPAFYPFDSYLARMHPELSGETENQPGVWYEIPVQTVGVDFSATNLTTIYSPGTEDGDWFTVSLHRPLWLKFVVSAAVVLLVLWAVSFPLSSKTEPAGLLALFVGIFGLRSSLLSGAPVFPSFIDYLSILLYTYVVMMLLLKKLYSEPERKCGFCKSTVHANATVCASCTRTLES